ncbi:hypothetical protein HanRHA438_Chr14g0639371 [Helianthus annuus]|nr:hypothetical protein HanRHA438_Chr14g0639371 [Helianthus annuus]
MSKIHGTNEADRSKVLKKTEGQSRSVGAIVRNTHSRASIELIHSPVEKIEISSFKSTFILTKASPCHIRGSGTRTQFFPRPP